MYAIRYANRINLGVFDTQKEAEDTYALRLLQCPAPARERFRTQNKVVRLDPSPEPPKKMTHQALMPGIPAQPQKCPFHAHCTMYTKDGFEPWHTAH